MYFRDVPQKDRLETAGQIGWTTHEEKNCLPSSNTQELFGLQSTARSLSLTACRTSRRPFAE